MGGLCFLTASGPSHLQSLLLLLLLFLLLLLLGVRRLYDQDRSGDEGRRLLQLLLAAVEFGRQGSTDRPHISSSFVKGASL